LVHQIQKSFSVDTGFWFSFFLPFFFFFFSGFAPIFPHQSFDCTFNISTSHVVSLGYYSFHDPLALRWYSWCPFSLFLEFPLLFQFKPSPSRLFEDLRCSSFFLLFLFIIFIFIFIFFSPRCSILLTFLLQFAFLLNYFIISTWIQKCALFFLYYSISSFSIFSVVSSYNRWFFFDLVPSPKPINLTIFVAFPLL